MNLISTQMSKALPWQSRLPYLVWTTQREIIQVLSKPVILYGKKTLDTVL